MISSVLIDSEVRDAGAANSGELRNRDTRLKLLRKHAPLAKRSAEAVSCAHEGATIVLD